MSKVVDNDVLNVNDEAMVEETFDPTVVYAQLVKRDDGYHVIDFDGTEGPVCKIAKDGISIALTPNKSNRKWCMMNVADKFIEEQGFVPLYYKATRHIGSTGSAVPNKGLIKYLSEEEQAEYMDIINRAKAAKAADKPAPKTDEDKIRAKMAKLQAQLDALVNED